MTNEGAQGTAAATASGPPPAALSDLIGGLIGDLRASLAARLDIAHIEARHALGVVLRSFAGACAAVLLALTAWWAVCALLVLVAVGMGLSWISALIGAAGANAVLAVLAARYARAQARQVGMPHTRRLFLDPDEGRQAGTEAERSDVAVADR